MWNHLKDPALHKPYHHRIENCISPFCRKVGLLFQVSCNKAKNYFWTTQKQVQLSEGNDAWNHILLCSLIIGEYGHNDLPRFVIHLLCLASHSDHDQIKLDNIVFICITTNISRCWCHILNFEQLIAQSNK